MCGLAAGISILQVVDLSAAGKKVSTYLDLGSFIILFGNGVAQSLDIISRMLTLEQH